MEVITKEIFRIIKSTDKDNIIGLARVPIKETGFIIKNVGLDLFYGRMAISMKASLFMTKCMGKENIILRVE